MMPRLAGLALAVALAVAFVALLLSAFGCAHSSAAPPVETMGRLLRETQCQHAMLNQWDRAERDHIAETCGPTQRACLEDIGKHEARFAAASLSLLASYRAIEAAVRQEFREARTAAVVTVAAARVAMRRLDVDVGVCRE